MHLPVVLVGLRRVVEAAAGPPARPPPRRFVREAPAIFCMRARKLVGAGVEILGDVIEHLRAIVRRAPRSSAERRRRLDRVADVLAVAEPGLPDVARRDASRTV